MEQSNHLLHLKNYCNIIYPERNGKYKKSSLFSTTYLENFKEDNYKSTDINTNQIRRLKRAVNNLILISPQRKIFNIVTQKKQNFRLNFITLTLPSKQRHTDKEITKEILSPFLAELQRLNKIGSYVWKAEKQKNGNIHYHITSNKFIHYQLVKDTWNKHLNNLNYIDDFFNKHGHRTPNSTDIHATKNIKNLEAYLVKYISKKAENKNLIVSSKKWDCSKNLKRKEQPVISIDYEISEILNDIFTNKKDNIIYKDYFTLIKNDTQIKKKLFKNEDVKKEFQKFVEIMKLREKEYRNEELREQIINNHKVKKMESKKIEQKSVYPLKARYIQIINGYSVPRYRILKSDDDYRKFKKYLKKTGYAWEFVNQSA